MTNPFHILADGIPPGLIFGVIVFFLWGLTAVFGKSKPSELKKPTGAMTDLAEVRRRILMEQAQEKRAAQGQVAAQRDRERSTKSGRKSKKQSRNVPPPLPTQRTAQTVAQALLQPSATLAGRQTPSAVTPLVAHRPKRSETSRNVRMMLQRSGMAEAFVLTEILGKPKGLD